MKKTLQIIFISTSVILFINICKMILTDFGRLNEFGIGFITGRFIVFLTLLLFAFLLRKKKVKS